MTIEEYTDRTRLIYSFYYDLLLTPIYRQNGPSSQEVTSAAASQVRSFRQGEESFRPQLESRFLNFGFSYKSSPRKYNI